MILSTQSYNSSFPLKSCGIDIEDSDRFDKWAETPPPFIYSADEIELAKQFDDPKPFLSAAFSLKEALFKALREPYNFTDCCLSEFKFNRLLPLHISSEFRKEYNISSLTYRLCDLRKSLIIAEVYLH